MTIRDQIQRRLKKAVKAAYPDLDIDPIVSYPELSLHGDYATNVALEHAKDAGTDPRVFASAVVAELEREKGKLIDRVDIAGPGFINVFLTDSALIELTSTIIARGVQYGEGDAGTGARIQIEFISANPTGPLTLANGRGGFTGDVLSNVLTRAGYTVHREYYVNDAGNQIRTLGASALAAIGTVEPDEKHYQGDYIAAWAKENEVAIKEQTPEEVGSAFSAHILETMIKPSVAQMGITFDRYFLESSVHANERAAIREAQDVLKKKDAVYEQDGATWFKSTDHGDDKDRVLINSAGEPTYILADIAHYQAVLQDGWARYINILGADHHGYVARARAAALLIGYEQFDAIVMQLVRLMENGKEVRMSKRRGAFVTMDDLLDEVPVDVARFFFLMYAPETHMDFDLTLAKEKSKNNPVYAVQYAYVRLGKIIEKANGLEVQRADKPLEDAERELLVLMARWPEVLLDVARTYRVNALPTYATKLADALHRFYARVIDAGIVDAGRLEHVRAAQIVFANVLSTMGISRPEEM
jgi:arginyl-tRNA synthetase